MKFPVKFVYTFQAKEKFESYRFVSGHGRIMSLLKNENIVVIYIYIKYFDFVDSVICE